MESKISQLHALGQSLWYDNIQRKLLKNGELGEMIERGEIRGVTSNPSIFNKAIVHSDDYDGEMILLAREGLSKEEIYEHLAVADIQEATDLFMSLYEETNGADGYVSLEVSPFLAYDTDKTIEEAKRIWGMVDRPNLMVKIPATKEGLPAITEAIAEGININVTLIFSLERYREVMDAYLSGLEKRLEKGGGLNRVASVASFFVSRIDTRVDARLQSILDENGKESNIARELLGKMAIASAKMAYQEYKKTFKSDRFMELESHGARIQRPLWASTSTKNPSYPDTLYIDNLIGPNTVNTIPPKTLEAFKDHGNVSLSLEKGIDEARKAFEKVEELGISMSQITQELEDDGVKAFADAFVELLNAIEERRKHIVN